MTASVHAQPLVAETIATVRPINSSLPDANPYNNNSAVLVSVTDPPIVAPAPLSTTTQTLTNQTVATLIFLAGEDKVVGQQEAFN